MKKFILILIAAFCLCSCTEQMMTREWGGEMTIELPKGQELMMATCQDDNLFYLTRPMAEDYVPVKKTFKESSAYGIMESTVYFIETR